MVRRSIYPPSAAWIIFSVGVSVFLCCSGWSLVGNRNYKLELAAYKLEVGSVISDVKKVSETLEQVSNSSASDPQDRQKIQKLTRQSNAVLDAVEQEIDSQTHKLLKVEKEE